MKTRILRCILAIAFAASAASAQQMNYQGRLTDNAGAPRPGPQATLTFSMWTLPTGGDKVWGDFALNADLIDGRFSVKLGDVNGNDGTADGGRLLSNAFATNPGPRYLEIKVGTDAPLPRQQVLPAPTALHAVIAGTVPDGAIGTPQLANLAVTGDKIADNTIPVAKLTGAGANFWDGNGTSVWRTGGNVGIGTVTPKGRLHVVGPHAPRMTFGSSAGIVFGVGESAGNYGLYFGTNGDGKSWIQGGRTDAIAIPYDISLQASGGNVGIGTTAPTAKLDVAGSINVAGNIIENGQHVPSSAENLRIVRGGGTANVPVNGANLPPFSGSGYTYRKISQGVVDVTFSTPFAGTPTVTANAISNGSIFCGLHGLGGVGNPSSRGFRIVMYDTSGDGRDWPFNFIAIGPR